VTRGSRRHFALPSNVDRKPFMKNFTEFLTFLCLSPGWVGVTSTPPRERASKTSLAGPHPGDPPPRPPPPAGRLGPQPHHGPDPGPGSGPPPPSVKHGPPRLGGHPVAGRRAHGPLPVGRGGDPHGRQWSACCPPSPPYVAASSHMLGELPPPPESFAPVCRLFPTHGSCPSACSRNLVRANNMWGGGARREGR